MPTGDEDKVIYKAKKNSSAKNTPASTPVTPAPAPARKNSNKTSDSSNKNNAGEKTGKKA
jgi:hypothetical protein